MGKLIPETEIRKDIESRDGELIKVEIINSVRYVTIKCNKDGNIWTAQLSNIKHKAWCKECYKRSKIRKVEFKDIQSLLNNNNLILTTKSIDIDYWQKIDIWCPTHDFTWTTSYGQMEKGYLCRFCSSGAPPLKNIKKALEDKNCEFVERIHTSCSVRNLLVRCNIHNHEWKTNSRDILKGERWCIYCAREARKTSYKAIKTAVEKRGGTLLTEDCNGSLTRIDVKCANDHMFNTTFDYVNQGYWCPTCPHKTQTKLTDIIQKLYPDAKIHTNYRGFDWLKMNKRKQQRMEIDIWVPDIKLAVEYDGEQHFMPVTFGGISKEAAKKNLEKCKRRDTKKTKLIASHPDQVKYFIRFNFKETINEANVRERLKRASVH